MTICVQCKHHREACAWTGEVDICLCAPLDYTRSPVNGSIICKRVLQGGGWWRELPYARCEKINLGNCEHYEPRPRRWWQVWRRQEATG